MKTPELVDIVDDTVKASDFNELKAIVAKLGTSQAELAEAQKRTEHRLEELAEAQKKTEQRLEELAEAQKRTEEEVRKLTEAVIDIRGELGGLSKSISYAFENEAFRMVPKVLKEKYGIDMKEKFVRKQIKHHEVNLFGKAKKDSKDVIVVGEAKVRLEEKGRRKKDREEWSDKVFEELEEKVRVVKQEFPGVEIVRLLITHFATNDFLKKARERGVIVVQSFEW